MPSVKGMIRACMVETVQRRGPEKLLERVEPSFWIFMMSITWTSREKQAIKLYSCRIYKWKKKAGLGFHSLGGDVARLPELGCRKQYLNL